MVRSVTHGGDIHNNPGLHILSRSSPVSTSPRGWCHLADIPPDLTKSELELLRHFWNVIPAAWSSENSYWWYYRLLNSSLGMHALSWRYSRYAQPVVRNRQLFKSNFCGWPTVSNVAWSITAISKYSREILLFILFYRWMCPAVCSWRGGTCHAAKTPDSRHLELPFSISIENIWRFLTMVISIIIQRNRNMEHSFIHLYSCLSPELANDNTVQTRIKVFNFKSVNILWVYFFRHFIGTPPV